MLVNIETQPMIAQYAVAGGGASLMTRSKHAAEWLYHGDAQRRSAERRPKEEEAPAAHVRERTCRIRDAGAQGADRRPRNAGSAARR
ncbi:hypothetical protein [Paraburkholderia sp. DGU8]|uniref:hypothetical protein n=1 Tax=Paraburkholderia sp. DGU8 TaxID=3161997 RepID=UPI00346667B1